MFSEMVRTYKEMKVKTRTFLESYMFINHINRRVIFLSFRNSSFSPHPFIIYIKKDKRKR